MAGQEEITACSSSSISATLAAASNPLAKRVARLTAKQHLQLVAATPTPFLHSQASLQSPTTIKTHMQHQNNKDERLEFFELDLE
jgi:hypothetical protein